MSTDVNEAEPLIEIGSFEIPNPGGDADAVRRAAEAWATMGADLRELASSLRARAASVDRTSWAGDSREAFEAWVAELAGEYEQMAENYVKMAVMLRKVADPLEETQRFVQDILVELGVTIGIGVAISFVSFGLGTAAAAARVAHLVHSITTKVRWLRGIYLAVKSAQATMQGIKGGGAILSLSGRFASTAAKSGASLTGGQMAVQRTLNPFAVWDASGARNLAITSGFGVGASSLRTVSRVERVAEQHRLLVAGAQGFATHAASATTIDALDGDFGRGTLSSIAYGGTASALTSALGEGLLQPRQGTLYVPENPGKPLLPSQGASRIVVPDPPLAAQAAQSIVPGGTVTQTSTGLYAVRAPSLVAATPHVVSQQVWRPSPPPGMAIPEYPPPMLREIAVDDGLNVFVNRAVTAPLAVSDANDTLREGFPEYHVPAGSLQPDAPVPAASPAEPF